MADPKVPAAPPAPESTPFHDECRAFLARIASEAPGKIVGAQGELLLSLARHIDRLEATVALMSANLETVAKGTYMLAMQLKELQAAAAGEVVGEGGEAGEAGEAGEGGEAGGEAGEPQPPPPPPPAAPAARAQNGAKPQLAAVPPAASQAARGGARAAGITPGAKRLVPLVAPKEPPLPPGQPTADPVKEPEAKA